MRRRVFVLAGLAAIAALGLAEVVQAHTEVVRAGRLLPFTAEHVREVRLFDSATLYVRRELMGPGDLANAFVLTMISGVSLLAALLLRRRSEARGPMRFFGVCWLGAAYLAVDEIAGVHETIAYNVGFVRSIPLGGDPTDALVAAGAIGAVAFGIASRRIIRASRTAVQLALAGGVLLAAGITFDAASLPGEEAVEVLVALSLLGAAVALALQYLTPAAERAAARDSREAKSQATPEPAPASI